MQTYRNPHVSITSNESFLTFGSVVLIMVFHGLILPVEILFRKNGPSSGWTA